jgi:hypothetical protein
MFCHFLDSLLANHVAWQTEELGANQHESHWVFDICYNNTSGHRAGDDHRRHAQHQQGELRHPLLVRNEPRAGFTDMQALWKHLYCGCDPEEYSNFMISPIGQIDRKLIAS